VDLGADFNGKNQFGNTALHQAFIKIPHERAVINYLLSVGASVTALNDFNQTPLFFATKDLIRSLGLS
jgi:ankyrin repeat protein